MPKTSETNNESVLKRKTLYRAVVGGWIGSLIGALFARPLVGFFHNFAPWVGPVAAVGCIAFIVLVVLLVPHISKFRADK